MRSILSLFNYRFFGHGRHARLVASRSNILPEIFFQCSVSSSPANRIVGKLLISSANLRSMSKQGRLVTRNFNLTLYPLSLAALQQKWFSASMGSNRLDSSHSSRLLLLINGLPLITRLVKYLSPLISKHLIYRYIIYKHRLLGPWSQADVLVQLIYIVGNIYCFEF